MDQYWIDILVLGIALVFVLSRIIQFFQQVKILQNGICAVGRIIEHRKKFSLLNPRGTYFSYYLTYRFDYEGKTYTQEQQVSKKTYLINCDETRVSLHFLPDDPTRVVMRFDEVIR